MRNAMDSYWLNEWIVPIFMGIVLICAIFSIVFILISLFLDWREDERQNKKSR